MHKSIFTVLHSIHLPHLSQFSCIYQNLHRNFTVPKFCIHLLYYYRNPKLCVHKSIFTVLMEIKHNTIINSFQFNKTKYRLQHLSQFSCIYQNLHRNFVLLHSQKSKICVHKSIFTVLQQSHPKYHIQSCIYTKCTSFCTLQIMKSHNLLYSHNPTKHRITVHPSGQQLHTSTTPFSQFPCIYQNLHRNFVLLHSQKSKICVHKSIFTVLQNTIIIIQNTSTTPFSIFMYLSKLTQKFCTSAFTEITKFVYINHRNPKFTVLNTICIHYIPTQEIQNTSTYTFLNFHVSIKTYTEIFVLLHSQKSKICVHKSIFTSTTQYNHYNVLQNTSTTPFSMFMYLSKLTHKFCTSAFTEIQNLCA